MEYYTTEIQEKNLNEKHMEKIKERQDQIRGSMNYSLSRNKQYQFIPPTDRIFIVENDKVYLGQVDETNICPQRYVIGGKTYGIDNMFGDEVEKFVMRHKKYMVIFSLSSSLGSSMKYCGGQGVNGRRHTRTKSDRLQRRHQVGNKREKQIQADKR